MRPAGVETKNDCAVEHQQQPLTSRYFGINVLSCHSTLDTVGPEDVIK
jgi:hypothetical protein